MLSGALIRLIGYALMIRLRGQSNPISELFIVQLIQGTGSGIVQTIIVVSTQIVVPHKELAQISALTLLMSFLGSSIGSTIAGGEWIHCYLIYLEDSNQTKECIQTRLKADWESD